MELIDVALPILESHGLEGVAVVGLVWVLKIVKGQLTANGGESVKDKVNTIDERVSNMETRLQVGDAQFKHIDTSLTDIKNSVRDIQQKI